MAIYTGPGQLSGKLGNVVFRKQKDGKTVVSTYTPPAIKRKNPAFAVAIHASKLFRDSLGEYYELYGSPQITRSLTGVFSKILSADKSPQSDRRLSMEFGRGELMGFQICNKGRDGLMTKNLNFSDEGRTIEMYYPPQNLMHQFRHFPEFLTYIQPILLAVPMPDWKFNEKEKEYQPVVPNPFPQVFFPKECPVWNRHSTIKGQSIYIDIALADLPSEQGLIIIHGILPVMDNNGYFEHNITHASLEIVEVIY
jgi:hypothetical protein